MVQNFRSNAELTLASVQARAHLLQFGHNRLPHLVWWHATRDGALRGLAACREITEIHYQQGSKAILQCGLRSQRRTLFQTFCQSPVGVHVSKEKMLQYLTGVPFSRRSLRQIAGFRARHCIIEFAPQVFKIGSHRVG